MKNVLEKCLADLEARIDEPQEQANFDAWRAFLDDEVTTGIFTPPARKPAPPEVNWPSVHINDAQTDPELMLLSQFAAISNALAAGRNNALGVRCNYGVAITASQFGCEIVPMPREQGNLPASRPLGADAARATLDAGVPDIRAGLGAAVFDTAEMFLDAMRRYPKIGRWVSLYHPDTQGPIDTAEVVWGSEIFFAFHDEPDVLGDFLDLMCQQYSVLTRAWFDLVGSATDMPVHWAVRHKGKLMIRNDSLMNLSPETYVEFVRNRDQRLLDEFGGGAIHFCGRGDHYIAAMSETAGLTAIQMSQPELNNMEAIFRHTIDKGIKLLDFSRQAAEAALAAGRDLKGQVHCA